MASDPYLKEYSEGVREIITSVNVVMAKAKQNSANVFMTFVELDDPYYNVAHHAVMDALKKIPMANMVKQFVLNGQELRSPGRGIMDSRESPLSRMVMALCMNPVIEAIDQSKGFPLSSKKKVACHAFVEKRVLISTTEEDMKEQLAKVGDELKTIGLEKIDANRCRYVAMTFNNRQMSVKNDLNFELAGQAIKGVCKNESWTFLGKKLEAK